MSEFDKEQWMGWVDDRLEAYVDGELSPSDRRRVEAVAREDERVARQLRLAHEVKEQLAGADRPSSPPALTAAILDQARAEHNGMSSTTASAPAYAPDRAPQAHSRQSGRRLMMSGIAALGVVLVLVISVFLGRTTVDAPVPGTVAVDPAPVEEAPQIAERSEPPAPDPSAAAPDAATDRLTPSNDPLLTAQTPPRPDPALDAAPSAGNDAAPPVGDDAAPAEEVEEALQEAKWALAYVSEVGKRTGLSIRQEVLEERVTEPVQKAVGTAFDDAASI